MRTNSNIHLRLVLQILASQILFHFTFAFTTPTLYTQNAWTTSLHSSIDTIQDTIEERPQRIIVVGGGWAGYSFCESISKNNLEIILLDASKDSKGGLAGGYRSEKNRPVEAGIHGFWREYNNVFDIMEKIEGIDVDTVLGDYIPSVLFSQHGRVALAPVIGNDDDIVTDQDLIKENLQKLAMNPLDVGLLRKTLAALVPPPLDLPILAEFDSKDLFSALPNSERKQLAWIDLVSAIGLLGAWADFNPEERASWERYDTYPAEDLFRKAGITQTLKEELVDPLLHVLPMCPAYDCSAAAALSCFHVFALQSIRGAFDVRWCRGSISELIFDPWQQQLENRGVTFQGGSRVVNIEKTMDDYKYAVTLDGSEPTTLGCDAIVFAVGANSMSKITQFSPLLQSLPATKDFDRLRGITCVAVRLFLKPNDVVYTDSEGRKTQLPMDLAKKMNDSPVAVCGPNIGNIPELKETGFCVYDLQRMQDEFAVKTEESIDDNLAVLEVDFYRADSIVNLSDDEIVSIALQAAASALETSTIDGDLVVDKAIVRARNAVSHFAPNQALYSSGVDLGDNIYICGDWIDRTGHSSWSTEKSVVTARQAAAALSRDLKLAKSECDVIEVAEDTLQLSLLRDAARLLRKTLPPTTLPPSPWILAKQLLSGDKSI
ncbi:hypothetical protein CTEN210_04527 [Chaetoceros tenuissimus]|uniref:Amine oxidase n=1 Tax=Chaetoceros tenuissimus TaxID=426638 RepID=A0AAD3CN76_9STRA|nr:hypothetical protein CTEN210_04527 [Chaetoceros tenuissimus]